jgi:hypothetical protein
MIGTRDGKYHFMRGTTRHSLVTKFVPNLLISPTLLAFSCSRQEGFFFKKLYTPNSLN